MARKNLILGLDMGSSSFKAIAAYFRSDSSKLEVIVKDEVPSSGVRKGIVVSKESATDSIASLLDRVEKQSGEMAGDVYLSLGGNHIFSTCSQGTVAVSRADQIISEEDKKRVIDAAKTFSLPPNREILEIFPQEFKVDNESVIREPVGMKGVRLEVKILVVGYFIPYYENLIEAVANAGCRIGYVMSTPLASAEAVLSSREKELGVLSVDIGAGSTSYSVFKEKTLLRAGVLPVGSFNITKDIAWGLKTDVDTAEQIKLEYGSCFLDRKKKLTIKEELSGEEVEFSQAKLGRIIDARTKEIFGLVEEELKEISSPRLPGGLVITGGGAKLPKIKEMAKEQLGMVTRIGTPRGFSPEQKDPSWSTVCGLAVKGQEFSRPSSIVGGKWLSRLKKVLSDLIP